jgi:hypothetical protein
MWLAYRTGFEVSSVSLFHYFVLLADRSGFCGAAGGSHVYLRTGRQGSKELFHKEQAVDINHFFVLKLSAFTK